MIPRLRVVPGSEDEKFRSLYAEHHRMVRAVLFNLTGTPHLEDLTQEVFLRVWRGLPRFGFRAAVRTWIYRVTVNTAIDHLRRGGLRLVPGADIERVPDETPGPATSSPRAQVQEALGALDDAHRTVVVLFYLEELSLKEIARILRVRIGTVKSRLHYARQRMKERLHRQGVDL